MSQSQRGTPGYIRKRGHQHHPRNIGTRGRPFLDSVHQQSTSRQQLNFKSPDDNITSLQTHNKATVATATCGANRNNQNKNINNENHDNTTTLSNNAGINCSTTTSTKCPSAGQPEQHTALIRDSCTPLQILCDDSISIGSSNNNAKANSKEHNSKSSKEAANQQIRKPSKNSNIINNNTIGTNNIGIINNISSSSKVNNTLIDEKLDNDFESITKINKTNKKQEDNTNVDENVDMSKIFRPSADGSSQSDQEDPEYEELVRLRCTSERTEVVAEREIRRRKRRCADYPGLAFGSSIFSSDTLMKFSIIRNELHNIMNTQLKRVVGS